jgi:hypothetical protein
MGETSPNMASLVTSEKKYLDTLSFIGYVACDIVHTNRTDFRHRFQIFRPPFRSSCCQ